MLWLIDWVTSSNGLCAETLGRQRATKAVCKISPNWRVSMLLLSSLANSSISDYFRNTLMCVCLNMSTCLIEWRDPPTLNPPPPGCVSACLPRLLLADVRAMSTLPCCDSYRNAAERDEKTIELPEATRTEKPRK